MKRKRFWKWFAFFALLTLIISAAFLYSSYQLLKTNYNKTQISLKKDHENEGILNARKPISFLFLGVDERENDRGRSDTIIVGALNPMKKEGLLISIPRDARVTIGKNEKKDKINHAYAFGGMQLATDTVENLLGMSINYTAKINMEGLSQLIDLTKGVTVTNPTEFSYNGDHFNKGEILLSGDEALNYSKMRKDDPLGDFGRQQRQKLVLKGLVDELTTGTAVLNLTSISTIVGSNLQTNLPLSQISDFQTHYLSTFNNAKLSVFSKGKDNRINGIYYYVFDKDELKSVRSKLQQIMH